MTAALRRSRRFLPFETMKRLYKAFRVLCAYSKELEMASQREWKTQMSIAFYLPKSCSYDTSGWYPILRIPQNFPIISLVFLGVSKLMPPNIYNLFLRYVKATRMICETLASGCNNKISQHHWTSWLRHSFNHAIHVIRIWNNLPSEVHQSEDLATFKKKHLFKLKPSLDVNCKCSL